MENGEIYQTKWYNIGDRLSAQVQYSWQTPWELIGPVLPGNHGPDIPTLPAGTYPAWSNTDRYQAGDKVLYQGAAVRGQVGQPGDLPGDRVDRPSGSPRKALYSIPGEPNGSPALGGNPATSPTSGATVTLMSVNTPAD